jgi:hypothetical protein
MVQLKADGIFLSLYLFLKLIFHLWQNDTGFPLMVLIQHFLFLAPQYLPKYIKNLHPHPIPKPAPNVHISSSHNCQTLEETKMPFSR